MFGKRNPEITVSDMHSRLADTSVTLLDVRTEQERSFASLGGMHIEMSELPGRLEELAGLEKSELVVYCRSGHRSANVVAFLRSRGFSGATNLKGGILAWSREIDSTIRMY